MIYGIKKIVGYALGTYIAGRTLAVRPDHGGTRPDGRLARRGVRAALPGPGEGKGTGGQRLLLRRRT